MITDSTQYHSCVSTHVQSKKTSEFTLSDTMVGSILTDDDIPDCKPEEVRHGPPDETLESPHKFSVLDSALPITREQLQNAQKEDPTLHPCFSGVISAESKTRAESISENLTF